MSFASKLALVLSTALLTAACDGTPPSGDGKTGHFVISNVQLEKSGPGVYEVTYDATWEGDLAVKESPCDVWLMGSGDTRLGQGKERIEESSTGIRTTVRDVEGTPERADVLCPNVAVIP